MATDYFNTRLGDHLVRIVFYTDTREVACVRDPYSADVWSDDDLLEMDGMRGCTREECAAWLRARVEDYCSIWSKGA